MSGRPIGVFDSGVGGLSVLAELKARLPNESFVFFADQHNVPYGEKTKGELVALTTRIVEFLLTHDTKLIVVACNTATCYALEELRARFSVPIVGVVPAVKLAAERTKTGTIALISTPATAKSDYVTHLIEQFAADKKVFRIGCAGLENAVETGRLDGEETATLLQQYVAPLKDEGVDELVLGCTHYPFLKKEISAIVGPGVELIDSGDAVARRTEKLLAEAGMVDMGGGEKKEDRFFTNRDAEDFSNVATLLLGRPVRGEYIAL